MAFGAHRVVRVLGRCSAHVRTLLRGGGGLELNGMEGSCHKTRVGCGKLSRKPVRSYKQAHVCGLDAAGIYFEVEVFVGGTARAAREELCANMPARVLRQHAQRRIVRAHGVRLVVNAVVGVCVKFRPRIQNFGVLCGRKGRCVCGVQCHGEA